MPHKHTSRIAHLEQVYPQHRNNPKGAEILLELDRLYREVAEESEAERMRTMTARMDALDQSVKALNRKEWQTLTFWIVLLTFLVASAALLRDVVDWTVFGFDSPAPKHQPQELPQRERPEQQSSTVDSSPSATHQSADPPP